MKQRESSLILLAILSAVSTTVYKCYGPLVEANIQISTYFVNAMGSRANEQKLTTQCRMAVETFDQEPQFASRQHKCSGYLNYSPQWNQIKVFAERSDQHGHPNWQKTRHKNIEDVEYWSCVQAK